MAKNERDLGAAESAEPKSRSEEGLAAGSRARNADSEDDRGSMRGATPVRSHSVFDDDYTDGDPKHRVKEPKRPPNTQEEAAEPSLAEKRHEMGWHRDRHSDDFDYDREGGRSGANRSESMADSGNQTSDAYGNYDRETSQDSRRGIGSRGGNRDDDTFRGKDRGGDSGR
jgi:hypothetical protein